MHFSGFTFSICGTEAGLGEQLLWHVINTKLTGSHVINCD